MAQNIDAKLKNIQGLFSNSSSSDSVLGKAGVFIVPDYQRAYNWRDNGQCDKLWQDIESFIENENEAYFLGSIIINNDNKQLYVIDGQQRLTTFMLLLKALLLRINSALRDMSSDEDAERMREALKARMREIISCLYSIEDDAIFMVIKGSKKFSELSIKYSNISINEVYKEEIGKILHGQTFDEIEKVVKKIPYKQKDNKYTNFFRNFKFFWDKLDCDSTKLNEFSKAFLQKCQVIVVISYQTEEAIEIFNSLNSTGMPLADADILSAKLYGYYGTDKTGFEKSWREIITNTNSLGAQKIAAIDDILNQYMYILRAEKQQKDTTLPGVRRYFTDKNDELLKEPKRFISDIETIIGIWQDEESTPELAALKQVLLRHNSNFKFFYAAYLYFNNAEADAKKQEFIEALLKLFAILSIKEYGYSSALFKSFLIPLNMEIGKKVPTDTIVQAIKAHIKKHFSRDDIYKTLVTSDPDNAVIYLNEYLFARETGTVVNLDIPKIEIEHIMPASGKNLPVIMEDANMSEEEFSQYVDKLGNKILLEQPINGAIANNWFKMKKQKSVHGKRGYRGYKDSAFPIAQSLTAYPKDTWEKDDIRKATEKAAERIADYIFS